MTRALAGQVALVTGASRGGTGAAIAVRFAAEGADVVITGRDTKGLAATAARIDALGGRCLVVPADLADPAGGRRSLVGRAEQEFGPVDVVVNSAALGGYAPFESWTLDQLEQMMQVNLWAPWMLMTEVVGSMRDRGRGAICNLTSFAAELPPGPPYPDVKPATAGSAYGATKAALNRLTVAAAAETLDQGVVVNALTPQAAIATPALVAGAWIADELFEPLETMAEAALALCTGELTGRIAYSLQLLVELDRPVRELDGQGLVDGWQPADLVGVIERQERYQVERGWSAPFVFHRPSSPS
ncbi:MAG: SDR family oxidoreductase [Acidimicrobiales bacterium]|nr:SDR family oxidoreductase [Acidimicrobiales bacterium]